MTAPCYSVRVGEPQKSFPHRINTSQHVMVFLNHCLLVEGDGMDYTISQAGVELNSYAESGDVLQVFEVEVDNGCE